MPTGEELFLQQLDSSCFETPENPSGIRSILFPVAGQMRSRKVVSRSNVRSAGKYPSWKTGRMMHWESSNELNAFRLLDCNPDVRSYSEQPCRIAYIMDGVERIHYPDILVATAEGKQLWEVKPHSDAIEPEFLTRAAFLSRFLPMWGYEYRTVLAEDLARQPRLSNANLLLRLGKRAVSDCEWEDVRRTMSERESLVWSEACAGNYGRKGREILCSLVLRGALAIEMDLPISPATEFVTRKEGL
jgi:hypothetical protein